MENKEKSLFSFKGIMKKSEYFGWFVLGVVLNIASNGLEVLDGAMALVALVVLLVPFIMVIAASARRLHSRNMTGWWQLVPFLSFVVMFLKEYPEDKILKKYGGTMDME